MISRSYNIVLNYFSWRFAVRGVKNGKKERRGGKKNTGNGAEGRSLLPPLGLVPDRYPTLVRISSPSSHSIQLLLSSLLCFLLALVSIIPPPPELLFLFLQTQLHLHGFDWRIETQPFAVGSGSPAVARRRADRRSHAIRLLTPPKWPTPCGMKMITQDACRASSISSICTSVFAYGKPWRIEEAAPRVSGFLFRSPLMFVCLFWFLFRTRHWIKNRTEKLNLNPNAIDSFNSILSSSIRLIGLDWRF